MGKRLVYQLGAFENLTFKPKQGSRKLHIKRVGKKSYNPKLLMNDVLQTKKCPYCAETINAEAIKCKHCGEILDDNLRTSRQQQAPTVFPEQKVRKWSPGIAALLSFLIPGAGDMYKGNVGIGLLWLLFVVLGYIAFVIIGLILHLICIFAAASGDPYK
jgi:TM2 domain-containing membrane protein YozV